MNKILRNLVLIAHWVCFAIAVAVLLALGIYSKELDFVFISLSSFFAATSLGIGAAIRWMFFGKFSFLPWR
jgi:hypothetical protein